MKLGYTKKWIEYNFLNEETLSQQVIEFEKGDDPNPEHYRYTSFTNWLAKKESLTNQEVKHYLELATGDSDKTMSGSAIKDLFVSDKISDQQFEMIKSELPQFGEWTQKLITREVLQKRINNEEIDTELFDLCLEYKNEFKDNRLIISIIKKTKNARILSLILELQIGKKIKKLTQNKLNKLKNN